MIASITAVLALNLAASDLKTTVILPDGNRSRPDCEESVESETPIVWRLLGLAGNMFVTWVAQGGLQAQRSLARAAPPYNSVARVQAELERLRRVMEGSNRRTARVEFELRAVEVALDILRAVDQDLKAEQERLNRDLLALQREVDDHGLRIEALEGGMADVWLELNDLDRRLRTIENSRRHYLYVEGGGFGQITVLPDRLDPFRGDRDPRLGFSGEAGFVGDRFRFGARGVRKGETRIRDTDSGDALGLIRRNSVSVIAEFPFGIRSRGSVRLSGEYQSDRETWGLEQAEHFSATRFLGGLGLGFGGWDSIFSRGLGLTSDWRLGSTDRDGRLGVPREFGNVITLQVKNELWGAMTTEDGWVMVVLRVFHERIDENPFEGDIGVDPSLPDGRYTTDSFGAFVGLRLLVR